jgi:hypothetical protein
MGYTHYFRAEGKCKQTDYAKALKDIRKIIKSKEKILANNNGEEGTKPEYSPAISFNGIGKMAHETFFLPETFSKMEDFSFCKTAQKPYDEVVVACLTVLHNYLGGVVKVSSDGDRDELEGGLKLARKVLKSKDLVNMLDEVPANSVKFIKGL